MIGNTSTETHFRFVTSHPPLPVPLHPPPLSIHSNLTPAPTPSRLTNPRTRLVITSDAFRSKMKPARHRMIYALLRDEMSRDNGIHALQLRTLTPEEEEKEKKKEAEEAQKSDG